MTKIPSRIKIGGQIIDVEFPKTLDNDAYGQCLLGEGKIYVAEFYGHYKQSETSKINTFYHEITHAILRTMGRCDLNDDESFVCCFSGFLADAMEGAMFCEETNDEL